MDKFGLRNGFLLQRRRTISRASQHSGSDCRSSQQSESNRRACQHSGSTDSAVFSSVIQSEKEKDVLTHNGHLFYKEKCSKDGAKKFWECVNIKSTSCRFRIHTNILNGQIVKLLGKHNHGKSAISIPLREVKQQVKASAKETMHHPAQIFNQVLTGVSQAVQSKLDKSAFRKFVQRTRNKMNNVEQVPNGILFNIPELYRNYRFGADAQELFLLADSMDADRILLFGRESNKNWTSRMKIVFVDGTFKITPAPFYQVYVILAERGGYVFPVLYALLPGKSQLIYEKMYGMILDLWPEFRPTSFSVDFELAAISAIRVKFNAIAQGDNIIAGQLFVTEKGNNALAAEINDVEDIPNLTADDLNARQIVLIWACFFHLVQNMKKKLGKFHLKSRYETDADFAVKCRMITSMAFVPPLDLIRVFDDLWRLMPVELEPIMVYFEKNYIGSINRRGNREIVTPPKFEHSLWNLYERTLNGKHRTNNFAEAANHRIQCEIDSCHPGIWNFINCLKVVQQGRDQQFVQWQAGKKPKGKRNKYKQADARILRIVEDYENRTTEEYLKGISSNYDMDD